MTSRRNILGVLGAGGLTPFAFATASEAKPPELEHYGLNISLSWRGEWCVAVPMNGGTNSPWAPGQPVAIEWMPLSDYLAALETECGINA